MRHILLVVVSILVGLQAFIPSTVICSKNLNFSNEDEGYAIGAYWDPEEQLQSQIESLNLKTSVQEDLESSHTQILSATLKHQKFSGDNQESSIQRRVLLSPKPKSLHFSSSVPVEVRKAEVGSKSTDADNRKSSKMAFRPSATEGNDTGTTSKKRSMSSRNSGTL